MGDSIMVEWSSKGMDGRTKLHLFRYHLCRAFIEPGDVVVDAGCGKGYGSEILSVIAKKVIGIDIGEIQINWNKEHYEKVKNIEFRVGNLEEIGVPECDVLCSFEVIEHFYEPHKVIKKMKDKTKKWIVVSVPIGEILVDDKSEVKRDATHHSAFPYFDDLDEMFIDDNWDKFYGFQVGVTYMAVYYKKDED